MKTKKFSLNIEKFTYNGRLPKNLPEKLPAYDMSSKDLIILYPLFKPAVPEEYDPRDCYAKTALWSMQSFLKNADVIEKSIPVKFYIQRSIYEAEEKWLKQNGVTDQHCLIFDEIDTADEVDYKNYKPNLGLKLLPFIDNRISDYNRVWINDTDLFLCKNPGIAGKKRFDILALAAQVPNDKIGVLRIDEGKVIPGNWISTYKKTLRTPEVWHKRAIEVAGKEFSMPEVWNNIFGPLYSYTPASVSNDLKAYIQKAIPVLRDDESIFSGYNMCYPDLNMFFPMKSKLNVTTVELERHIELVHKFDFYFSHIHFRAEKYEQIWRQHIGCIDD